MPRDASELARRLARDAEAVCRHYLSKGRRQGRYWMVGDVRNTPGRSMYVRLSGPEAGPGAAGRWRDAASAEHGDLLDLIGIASGAGSLRAALVEAYAFLASHPVPAAETADNYDRTEAARRLWRHRRAIDGTHAEAYLRTRGIERCRFAALRFHPGLFYRDGGGVRRLPALVAALTGSDEAVCGVLRTWLHPTKSTKANMIRPRKALGRVHGRAVRFGDPGAGTRRSSTRGTPRGLFGSSGSITLHSKSVRS